MWQTHPTDTNMLRIPATSVPDSPWSLYLDLYQKRQWLVKPTQLKPRLLWIRLAMAIGASFYQEGFPVLL